MFAIFLDLRYKTTQFQSGSNLHFTERTEQEVCKLIKEEYQLQVYYFITLLLYYFITLLFYYFITLLLY